MTHSDKSTSNRGRVQQTVQTQSEPMPVNIVGVYNQVSSGWKAFCQRMNEREEEERRKMEMTR